MATIRMIRHGKASGSWSSDPDPGLDDRGRRQAQALAEELQSLPPQKILTSPMLRAQETAAPVAESWQSSPVITEAVSEIPSPPGVENRSLWLQAVMADRWSSQSAALRQWRNKLLSCLLAQTEDRLIFSHFVAINLAVGAALSDDRCLIFRPDHCSVTCLKLTDGRLELAELGSEAQTEVK